MVKSLLTDSVDYNEDKKLDEDDIDYDTSIYVYTIDDIDVDIALGKIKYTYSNKNVLYCSIYLIVNDEPKSRIGIFEINKNKLLNSIDDNEIDLENGNIIIFENIENIKKHMENVNSTTSFVVESVINEDTIDDDLKLDIEEISDLTDDALKLSITEKDLPKSSIIANKEISDNLFVIDNNYKSPPLLPEENEVDNDEIKQKYEENKNDNWIVKFTKNTNYQIVDNEGSGDCLFAVIRDAYQRIGKTVTISKLRALLSKEVSQEIFDKYKLLYNNFNAEFQNINNEIKEIKKLNNELKIRGGNVKDREEHRSLVSQAKELNERYQKLLEDRINMKELLDEFIFMQDINDLEQLRQFVMTRDYWADEWALSTFEKLLNIKFIILNENSYHNNDLDAVMTCGPTNNNDSVYKPELYIITSYTGNHYKLIEYKEKGILQFQEIPYDIKNLIMNKCIEKNSGSYYLIEDFRSYKTNIGLDPDLGKPDNNDDDYLNNDLYHGDTVFMFHSNSNPIPNAGKGIGEKINNEDIITYKDLNTKKRNSELYNWRRKLDDNWGAPFSIDNHRWKSVTHYLLGSRYKKGFPDFYEQFSLDSESDIANEIEKANAAVSKTGKYKNLQLRPDNVIIDADYYEIGANREEDERKKALEAKFTQNLDLKKVLMETKRAKLMNYVRRGEPKVDTLLMKLRKEMI